MPDVDEDSELSSGLDLRGLRNTGHCPRTLSSTHVRLIVMTSGDEARARKNKRI